MAQLYYASDYAYGNTSASPPLIITNGFTGTGAQSCTVGAPTQGAATPYKDGYGESSYSPLATNAPITVGIGAVAETVTPSAVTAGPPTTITATFTYAHGNGTIIASGSYGLQEAINAASNVKGGAVVVDGRWAQIGGTTSTITSAANGSGSNQVFILDERGSNLGQYVWNGTAWISSPTGWPAGANGQSFVPFVNTELLTLSTSGTTTDTTGNLLPANSLILAVTGTVQTTIVTATDWKLGDATTAGRFSAADSTLTAAESVPKASFPPVQIGTGVASATTGVYQAAAAKVRVTTTGTPSAGKIRITVYGFTLINAAS